MPTLKSRVIPPISKADADRFWSLVKRDGNDLGCWNWAGSVNSKGYGRFFVGGKHYYAHRLAWSMQGRETPANLFICHTCDNPLCVNPHHLMMADAATNNADAKHKRNLKAKRAGVVKPRADYPLTPRGDGRWCKKIRGRIHYFTGTAEEALEEWLRVKDDMLAGRTPRPKDDDRIAVDGLANAFLTAKRERVEAGEMAARSWGDYHATCAAMVEQFGKGRAVADLRPEDFAALRKTLAKRVGPVRLGNEIQRVRSILKWAFESELIDVPPRTGPEFKKPAKHVVRKARADVGPRMFEAADLQAMLKAAPMQLRAMIYLGLNAGLGNNDCGSLRLHNVDLAKGWLDFPRPKTGIPRRCPLWPETVEALRKAIAERPEPIDSTNGDRAFITADRVPWTGDAKLKRDENGDPAGAGPRVDAVTKAFRRLLDSLDLHRRGLGFYTLRHVFETVAGAIGDQVAVDCVMGHADHTMAGHYRERIDDARLLAVVEHVRRWLFPPTTKRNRKTRKGGAA
ncbi:MAG TPA: HNH endonuclease [Pirellulales bacterium]|jgi:integrase|nr:HNH endonuclease [Pirellulales bacterium]